MSFTLPLENTLFSDRLFLAVFVLVHLAVGAGLWRLFRELGPARRKVLVAAVLLFAVSLGIFLHGIEDRSIWDDEYQQANFISRCDQPGFESPACLVKGSMDVQHPPGPYFYGKAAYSLLGLNVLAARAPSAVAGALGVAFLFLLFFFSTGEYWLSFFGAAQLIAHAYVFYYAREGRPHIFAVCYAPLAALAVYHYFYRPESRGRWWFLLSAVLLFLLSCGLQPPIFLLCLTACIFLLGREWRRGMSRSQYFRYLGAVAIGALILLPYLLAGMKTAADSHWVKPPDFSFLAGMELADPYQVLWRYLRPFPWIYALVAGVGGIVAVPEWRRSGRKHLFFFALIFSVILFPAERIIFRGLLDHSFFPRYGIVLIPCILSVVFYAGCALREELRRRNWRKAGLGAPFALLALVAANNIQAPRHQAEIDEQKTDWREIFADLKEQSGPGDYAVILFPDINQLEDPNFFGAKFYYGPRGPVDHARLGDFWQLHPNLVGQLREAFPGPGALYVAVDLTRDDSLRDYFTAHRGDWEWSVIRRTYGMVKLTDKKAGVIRLLLDLAKRTGPPPLRERLKSLAAEIAGPSAGG